HNNEGRSITVEYEKLFVVTVYVPNSGEKLVRLDYRTKEWDVALKAYVKSLEAQGKPVVLNGDLNVAHLDLDIYNRGAKHLPKNAATTKEERDSFDSWVNGGKVSDAFRRLHPDAEGAYTYWSVRTGAVSRARTTLRPRVLLLVMVVVVRVHVGQLCCCRLMGHFVVLCIVRSKSTVIVRVFAPPGLRFSVASFFSTTR
ncbi:unnamed protein product, partial [Ectocarpus sp. 13 AM-2016]